MTCIDAAIIKALVSHIGMNPDDVPTTGSNDSSNVFDTSRYTKRDNLSVTETALRITYDEATDNLKVGDVFIMNSATQGVIGTGFVISFTKKKDIKIVYNNIVDKKYTIITFKYSIANQNYNSTDFKIEALTTLNATVELFASGISHTNYTFWSYHNEYLAEVLRDLIFRLETAEADISVLKSA